MVKLNEAGYHNPRTAEDAWDAYQHALAVKREHAIDTEFDRLMEEGFQEVMEDMEFTKRASDLIQRIISDPVRSMLASEVRAIAQDVAERMARERVEGGIT